MATTASGTPGVGGGPLDVLESAIQRRASIQYGSRFLAFRPGTRLFPPSPCNQVGKLVMTINEKSNLTEADMSEKSVDPATHLGSLIALRERQRQAEKLMGLPLPTASPVFPTDGEVRAPDLRERSRDILSRPRVSWRNE